MTASSNPSPDPGHAPVMPLEVVAGLNVAPGDVVLDCTAGRGGHAALLATAAGEDGTIVLCDLDPGNLEFAAERVQTTGPIQVKPFQGSFARVPRDLRAEGLLANAVLADLGFASTQIDDASRGFS
ncbi:MAG: 16S rRNA (cytosine(1402)-N(4))-methyltransferase, partial [Phycisphaerales bacterium]